LDNVGANNGRLSTEVQIVDSCIYTDGTGTDIHKFRFDKSPLGTSSATSFHMVPNGTAGTSDSKYPMVTWDFKSRTGSVGATLTQDVSTTAGDGDATIANAAGGGETGVDFTELSAGIQALLAAAGDGIVSPLP